MEPFCIFALGSIGAIAPEIMRFYKSRTKPLPPLPRTYHLISILFALLGGLVVVILPTTTLWGAFYAGVSLPTIISGIGGKTATPEKPKSFLREEDKKAFQKPLESRRMTVQEFLGILFL